MRQFYVTLKKAAIEASIIVKSIPIRLYPEIKNRIFVRHKKPIAVLNKIAHTTPNILKMASFCGAVMEKYLSTAGDRMLLKTKEIYLMKAIPAKAALNTIKIVTHSAFIRKVQYRYLRDMDPHGVNKFDISVFDNRTLEELDYYYSVFISSSANVLRMINKTVQGDVAKYRTLGGMDTDGTNLLYLSVFDNMTLESVDSYAV